MWVRVLWVFTIINFDCICFLPSTTAILAHEFLQTEVFTHPEANFIREFNNVRIRKRSPEVHFGVIKDSADSLSGESSLLSWNGFLHFLRSGDTLSLKQDSMTWHKGIYVQAANSDLNPSHSPSHSPSLKPSAEPTKLPLNRSDETESGSDNGANKSTQISTPFAMIIVAVILLIFFLVAVAYFYFLKAKHLTVVAADASPTATAIYGADNSVCAVVVCDEVSSMERGELSLTQQQQTTRQAVVESKIVSLELE